MLEVDRDARKRLPPTYCPLPPPTPPRPPHSATSSSTHHRRRLANVAAHSLEHTDRRHCLVYSPAMCIADDEAAERNFNAFCFWRQPLLELKDTEEATPRLSQRPHHRQLGPGEASMQGSRSQRLPPATEETVRECLRGHPEESAAAPLGGERAAAEQPPRVRPPLELEVPLDEQTAGLLAGGAGERLLGLLGRLSSHLGHGSRFSRAAEALQSDVQALRTESAGPERQGLENSAREVQRGGVEVLGFSDAASPSGGAAGSTLRPQVMASVESMLRLLETSPGGPTPAALEAQFAPAVQQFLPTPASPAAVQRLLASQVRWEEAPRETARRGHCPICLEALSDAVLQMPCSHLFHLECLTQWLGTRNSCPVCRHLLPTEDEPMA